MHDLWAPSKQNRRRAGESCYLTNSSDVAGPCLRLCRLLCPPDDGHGGGPAGRYQSDSLVSSRFRELRCFMASQPARDQLSVRPARPTQPPRPRSTSEVDRSADLDALDVLPSELRVKVDPAVVVASLQAQIEEIRAGRAVGIDGDSFFAEWDQRLKRRDS